MTDAEVLRRAIVILRRRSTRPDGFAMGVLVRLVEHAAERIEAEAMASRHAREA